MIQTEQLTQQQTLHARGICVIIPTYNNEGTIESVVRECCQQCNDVIVVNDGSTDSTGELLRQISDITLVEYTPNKGKGYALREGFRKALAMGFAYAITIDADGQHHPEDISLFLKANQDYPGALIMGSRDLKGVDRSAGSSFANKFSNFWFYVQTGRRLEDTQTGYRLYPLKKLHGLSLLTSRYEAELELIVFASWHGVKLVSIPVRVYYPPREERVSHFRPKADFARISVLNTVLCILAVLYGLPLRLFRFLARLFRTVYSLLFFIFFIWFIITPIVWLYIKIGKMTEKKRQNIHQIIYKASRIVMLQHGIPGVRFSYQMSDEQAFSRPAVVISNHQSHLDLMCKLIFTPNIVFLTNDWVWNNPFYGFVIRHAEYYPVADGIDALMPKLHSLMDRGYSIAIYPEGTRSKDCRIGRFHQGAFYVAEQLGVDILPVYLYGPGRILPKKKYSLHKGPIYVEVGERITPKELQAMGDTKRQASLMRKHYISKLAEISNRIEQNV